MMKKLMDIMAHSCEQASLLVEKRFSEPLSFSDNMRLNMHLMICKKCGPYSKQSLLIENLLKSYPKNFPVSKDLKLSEATKSRIQKAIEENSQNK